MYSSVSAITNLHTGYLPCIFKLKHDIPKLCRGVDARQTHQVGWKCFLLQQDDALHAKSERVPASSCVLANIGSFLSPKPNVATCCNIIHKKVGNHYFENSWTDAQLRVGSFTPLARAKGKPEGINSSRLHRFWGQLTNKLIEFMSVII